MRRFAACLLALVALAEDEGPGASRLDAANKEAATRTVTRAGGHLTNRLRGLRKEDVIVVGGLFDFAQEILVAFRCPHTVVTPAELEHVPLDEPERKIFLLNCHLIDREFPHSHERAPRPGAKEAAARLKRVLKEAGIQEKGGPGAAIRERFLEVKYFAGVDYTEKGLKRMGAAVKAGAWLYSNDWAVLAVEKALPGTVRWTGYKTFEERVEVYAALAGRRHSLLDGVFEGKKRPKWWLEKDAYLFSMKGRYKLLVESRQLGARYRGNKNVVGLVTAGKGRVLHALSHAYLQQGKADDMTSMQRLLLNYLIEKSIQNHRRATKKK